MTQSTMSAEERARLHARAHRCLTFGVGTIFSADAKSLLIDNEVLASEVSALREQLASAGPKRIEVDIGAAMAVLQASPELGDALMSMVAPVAAQDVAAANARAEAADLALAKAQATIGEKDAALKNLIFEVSGVLAVEDEIRNILGNSNVEGLRVRRSEARAALSDSQPGAAVDIYGAGLRGAREIGAEKVRSTVGVKIAPTADKVEGGAR